MFKAFSQFFAMLVTMLSAMNEGNQHLGRAYVNLCKAAEVSSEGLIPKERLPE